MGIPAKEKRNRKATAIRMIDVLLCGVHLKKWAQGDCTLDDCRGSVVAAKNGTRATGEDDGSIRRMRIPLSEFCSAAG
jgi:hypothetical protein